MLDKFATILEARQWAEKFVHWYNNEHLHSALKFVTPQQRHSGEDEVIRLNRHRVYEAAKAQHPERWSGKTRDWSLADKVTLNKPNKKKRSDCMTKSNDDVGLNIKLPEQERLDGAGDGSGQTADAVRQYG
jgi:putative transposase